MLEPDRLSLAVRNAFDDPNTELALSPLSIFEAILMGQRSRVRLSPSPEAWVRNALEAAPVRELFVTPAIAKSAALLDRPPRDPIDRLLVATASVSGCTLVTADEEILALGGCRLLSNRA
jgi:PIN domain nuclease of toxin-antitoxin system